MAPDPKPAGLLAAGFNPAAVDWVCARLMGFDPDRIPHIRESFHQEDLPVATFGPEVIEVSSNDPRINIERLLEPTGRFFAFEPHFGWKGHIEAEGVGYRASGVEEELPDPAAETLSPIPEAQGAR